MKSLENFLDSVTVEDLEHDPFPIYARIRDEGRVAYVPCVDLWFATTWNDVAQVGADFKTFSAELADSPLDITFGGRSILTMEGPEHLALRQSMDEKYRPKNVSSWIEAVVRPIVRAQLTKLTSDRSVDLLAEFFEPISVLSLGSVLGVGHLEDGVLRRWFYGLREGAINYESSAERFASTLEHTREIEVAMAEVFDRLEVEPDDSTLSHMLHTGMPAGQMRSRSELMPTIKVMLLGGAQEPGHGAATTLFGLLTHPDQFVAVSKDPELIPVAVDEGVRWVSPIGTQVRETQSEVSIGGSAIPAGQRIAAVLSSANRDRSVFGVSADEFDIKREKRAHAAFGFGRHFCTGHAFSKMQISIAIEELVGKYPSMILDPLHEVRFEGWEFRAPTSLYAFLD